MVVRASLVCLSVCLSRCACASRYRQGRAERVPDSTKPFFLYPEDGLKEGDMCRCVLRASGDWLRSLLEEQFVAGKGDP